MPGSPADACGAPSSRCMLREIVYAGAVSLQVAFAARAPHPVCGAPVNTIHDTQLWVTELSPAKLPAAKQCWHVHRDMETHSASSHCPRWVCVRWCSFACATVQVHDAGLLGLFVGLLGIHHRCLRLLSSVYYCIMQHGLETAPHQPVQHDLCAHVCSLAGGNTAWQRRRCW